MWVGGALQKGATQLMIRSYELGVLFTPDSEAKFASATASHALRQGPASLAGMPVTHFHLPYSLPPAPCEFDVRFLECPSGSYCNDLLLSTRSCVACASSAAHHLLECPREDGPNDHPWAVDIAQDGYDRFGRSYPPHECQAHGRTVSHHTAHVSRSPIMLSRHDSSCGGNAQGSSIANGGESQLLQMSRVHNDQKIQQATTHRSMDCSNIVQWQWRASKDRWEPFPPAICSKLEKAMSDHNSGHVEVGGGRAVNLISMKQYVVAQKWRTRDVRRCVHVPT